MAEQTEDVEILLTDTPVTDGVVIDSPPEGAIEKREVAPEQGVETLKRQLDEEKAARERERTGRLAAETTAREESRRAADANNTAKDTNVHLVTNAIEGVRQSTELLKVELATAFEARDFGTVADIQVKLGANGARLQTLESGLEQLKSQPKQAPRQVQTDPVEMLVAQLTAKSAAWVRSHPEFASDPRLNRRMIRAHEDAIDDGHAPESDAYFSAVEQRLGLTHATDADDNQQQRRAAPPAAPVSRGASNGGPGGKLSTIRLSPAEVEMAEMMQMTTTEYAKQKSRLIQDGKLNG